MPLYRNLRLSPSASLGIWKIEENPEFLRSGIELNAAENEYYESLRSDLRKKHWLGYRKILTLLMKKEDAEIFYDPYGKPCSVNRNVYLSVTHSGNFSAAIVSSDKPVGIDIEMLKDRIERVKDKFLCEDEQAMIGSQYRLEKLYICWGAKESLYKLYGKPEVEFSRDIFVEPFEYTDENGCCTARMKTPERTMIFPVHFEKIEDYMLVYTTGAN